ncbi:hypothetical protein [Natronolimnohabitans innermongolicus]|nr:hypothetical protein [Natronolimnohabitans innermongolicus]
MGMFERLGEKVERLKQEAAAGREGSYEYGCRNCGTGFYSEPAACPECGSDEIAPVKSKTEDDSDADDGSATDDESADTTRESDEEADADPESTDETDGVAEAEPESDEPLITEAESTSESEPEPESTSESESTSNTE